MSRPIDADELKLSLLTLQNVLKVCGFINGVGWVQVLIDAVDVTQTADVAEVKHGEWLENGANYKCSICGNTESYYSDSYCRVCGAKMDGGDMIGSS